MTVYYNTLDLHLDGKDVIILSPEGEVVAKRKTITRKERTWIVWGVRITERLPGRPLRYRYVDLPKHVEVTRWRPEKPWEWPSPLPEPARLEGAVAWQSKPPPAVPQESSDPLDWQGEYSLTGNISEREAEVRVLRGLRTERSRFAVKDDSKTTTRDSVVVLMLRQLGKMEYDHKDPNFIGAVGELWEPTRRDHGDWIEALAWWARLNRAQREIIMLRSLNPPFSFQLIGERNHPPRSHDWAWKRYRAAIKELTKIANGG